MLPLVWIRLAIGPLQRFDCEYLTVKPFRERPRLDITGIIGMLAVKLSDYFAAQLR